MFEGITGASNLSETQITDYRLRISSRISHSFHTLVVHNTLPLTFVCVCVKVCICVSVLFCVCVYVLVCMLACVSTCLLSCVHACMCVCVCVCV